MNTNIDSYSQPIGRERIVMPGNGIERVAQLRAAAPAVKSVQDTCALSARPSMGHAHWAVTTDAGTVAFAGIPAWSPPI